MNQDMQKEILARIDVLAQKLGIGAQYLWALYVRQAKIDALECGACFLVCAGVFWYSAANVRYQFTKEMHSYEKRVAGPLLTAAIVVSVIVGCPLFCNGLDLLLNPQLCAFKEIMHTIK